MYMYSMIRLSIKGILVRINLECGLMEVDKMVRSNKITVVCIV